MSELLRRLDAERVRRVERELAGAQRDTKRIDRLAREHGCTVTHDFQGWHIRGRDGVRLTDGGTLREAIDRLDGAA